MREFHINTKKQTIQFRYLFLRKYWKSEKYLEGKRNKKIISLKSQNHISSNYIIDNNDTPGKVIVLANIFKKYYSTVALDVQSCIRYYKKCSDKAAL